MRTATPSSWPVPTGRRPEDAWQLPVRDGCFDVVLAAHMLYHVPDIDRALRDIRRALRPSGTALLVANGADDKAGDPGVVA
ncbi:MAG TPA: class I SAM-dependent methyltransferase [Acidimicrobiales bacterium]